MLVFENFTSAAARKELIALLDDTDELICSIAAQALMEHGDSSARSSIDESDATGFRMLTNGGTSRVHYGKSGQMTNLLKQF